MKHQKLTRSKYDIHNSHIKLELSKNVYSGKHSGDNGDSLERLSHLLSHKNYTMDEFLMKKDALLFVILDFLSFDKSYFGLKTRSNATHLNTDSRHMTTDTTTILGFLTLGK